MGESFRTRLFGRETDGQSASASIMYTPLASHSNISSLAFSVDIIQYLESTVKGEAKSGTLPPGCTSSLPQRAVTPVPFNVQAAVAFVRGGMPVRVVSSPDPVSAVEAPLLEDEVWA